MNLKDYLTGSFQLFCEEQIFLISLSLLFFLSGVGVLLLRICGLCNSFIFNSEPSSSCDESRLKFGLDV